MNVQEYGEAVSLSGVLLGGPNDDVLLDAVVKSMAEKYAKYKFAYFPSWPGSPTMNIVQTDPLARFITATWYAAVPFTYIISEVK